MAASSRLTQLLMIASEKKTQCFPEINLKKSSEKLVCESMTKNCPIDEPSFVGGNNGCYLSLDQDQMNQTQTQLRQNDDAVS